MVTDDPRSGDDEFEGDPRSRRPRPTPDDDYDLYDPPNEYDTKPIPRVRNTGSGFDDLPEFDDDEFLALASSPVEMGPSTSEPFVNREPSDLVRRYLFPTEKFRGEWRRHWIHLVRHLVWGVLATFALGYASGWISKSDVPGAMALLVVLWAIVMGWVGWAVMDWYFDRFALTNKRIMLINGIITRKVAMMPLGRVTDMKYTQSPMGRILGYDSFEIESAGQDQALREVKNLPNPTDLYLQVVEEMYEPEASEARRSAPDDA
jgi:membrane protein YdbS with pleckstrin-like domain